MIVASPALVEAYAVLSRLPPPRRLSPAESLALLEVSFLRDNVDAIALDADAYRHLLESAPERRVAGGSTYDAVIIACAQAAGVDTLLTFNERQFLSLAVAGVKIVVPA